MTVKRQTSQDGDETEGEGRHGEITAGVMGIIKTRN